MSDQQCEELRELARWHSCKWNEVVRQAQRAPSGGLCQRYLEEAKRHEAAEKLLAAILEAL